jgi:multidrug efflux system membrane fusion protein
LIRLPPLRGLALAALFAAVALPAAPARAQAPNPAAQLPPVPVTVAAAARRDVPILLRNIGAVQAGQTAAIRPRVDGTLEAVFFTEGQEVKRGDLLARIDPRPYQAVLDQALARRAATEANLANARLDLARSSDLARSQFASRQAVDTRAAQVAQLEAQLKADEAAISAAQVNLDYTSITAPFDGRLGLRSVDPGNVVRFANDNVVIVTISQIRPVVVVFALPQDTLPAIQDAMARGTLPVTALSPDERTTLGQGELITTESVIDQSTGTIRMKARFPNESTRLWPGQFVNVRLQLEIQRGVVTVPSVAVQRGPQGLFVYTVKDDNTVEFTRVEVGQDDGAHAIIRRGVEAGTRVVVAGHSRLRAGARVTINAPPGTAPPGPPGGTPPAGAPAAPGAAAPRPSG